MMTPAQYCFDGRLRCRAAPCHLWSPWIWNSFQVWTLLPITQIMIGFLDVAQDRSCIGKFKLKCLQIAPFQVCHPKKILVGKIPIPTPPRRFAPRTCASHMLLTYITFHLHPWPDQSNTPYYAPEVSMCNELGIAREDWTTNDRRH